MKNLPIVLLLLAACGTDHPTQFDTCDNDSDCATGEICAVATKLCSPTCSGYDDCYQMGLDAVCHEGVCTFNCPDALDSGFRCDEYELGYRVVSCE